MMYGSRPVIVMRTLLSQVSVTNRCPKALRAQKRLRSMNIARLAANKPLANRTSSISIDANVAIRKVRGAIKRTLSLLWRVDIVGIRERGTRGPSQLWCCTAASDRRISGF